MPSDSAGARKSHESTGDVAATAHRNACSYCGYLDWTVDKYGRVTHKQSCPMRRDPWHQGDPFATEQTVELEIRQNELYLAMRVVESMPASEAQTACIVRLGERMRRLVELRGKSEVGRSLDA